MTACERPPWAQFGYDAGHARATTDNSINLVNAPSLTESWTGATGGAITSSPAVAGTRVFVGSGNGRLYAFPAAGCGASTCDPLWTAQTQGTVASSPAVANGVVYVGSNDGKLYAFDAAGSTGCSGSPVACLPLWTGATGGPVRSSPTVVGSTVYVGSDDGKLYAFSATGCSASACAPLWTASTGGKVSSSPAVAGGRVYVGSEAGSLFVFDAAGAEECSGSPAACGPLWRASIGAAVTSSPAISGGQVFVGANDGVLRAFDAAGAAGCEGVPLDCRALWSAATGGPIASSPSLSGGRAYVGSDDGYLYAFDQATGVRRWRGAAGTGAVKSSPSVVGGVVFVGGGDGSIRAFDAAGELHCTTSDTTTCTPVWTGATGLAVRSSVAISQSTVFAGSDDAKLHVFSTTRSTTPIPPVVARPAGISDETEVTVRWTPATRVDLPITGYQVIPSIDGVPQSAIDVGPGTFGVTLANATPAHAYTFTVASRVGSSLGAPSPASVPTSPSPSRAPASYQLYPTHNAVSRSAPLPPNPQVLWSRTVAGSQSQISYPVVADGRVFVTASTDGGAYGGSLYAFDQATGAPLWGPISLAGTFYVAGVAYEDGLVYTLNYNGALTAFDEATGAVRWTVNLPEQSVFNAAPSAYRGLVYVAGIGGRLYAVNGRTGAMVWATDFNGSGNSTPAVDAGGVYVSYDCGTTYAFDPESGRVRWGNAPCSGGGGTTPVLAGDRLYRRFDPLVLSTADGSVVGTHRSNTTPAITGGIVYSLVGWSVTATDASTNAPLWSRDGSLGILVSAPLVIGDVVVSATANGVVYAYDRLTGNDVWSVQTGGDVGFPNERDSRMLTGMSTTDGRLFLSAGNQLIAIG